MPNMNWGQIEGKWKEMTGNVKAKWGDLIDDEIAEVNGNCEALEGKVQAKCSKTKEEAKKEVDDIIERTITFVAPPVSHTKTAHPAKQSIYGLRASENAKAESRMVFENHGRRKPL